MIYTDTKQEVGEALWPVLIQNKRWESVGVFNDTKQEMGKLSGLS